MPEDFNKCVRDGGKIVTQDLPGNKYRHLCQDKQGKWHAGETKLKKGNKK